MEAQKMNERDSMIGKSIRIKGEIAASEPLYILGSFEGTINAPNDRVTIAQGGKVDADINAREVVIMGEVCGNIDGADRVEIRKEGLLTGNLAAHRVSIEDGAVLRGRVDVLTPIEKEKPEANTGKPHVIREGSGLDHAEFTHVVELQLAGD
jgi:cytoskeletal protein CcmA (bactofilin family)